MANTAALFLGPIGPYAGYIIGVSTLAAVLFLNQLIYRHWWKSYPTLAEYLAAHPGCNKARGPRLLPLRDEGRTIRGERERPYLPLYLVRNRSLPA